MGKHAHKRQKTDNNDIIPIGSKLPQDEIGEKDDEERRLESLVFGVPYTSSKKGKKTVLEAQDNENQNDLDEMEGAGAQMEYLQDSDLFFVDNQVNDGQDEIPDFGDDFEFGKSDNEDVGSSAPSGGEEESVVVDDPQQNDDTESLPPPKPTQPKQSNRKTSAWIDPDDAGVKVSLTTNKRLRKLRDAASEDVIKGPQYEGKLRREFEKINPAPEWAAKARSKLHKKKRRRDVASSASEGSGGEDEAEDEDGIEELINSTNGVISSSRSEILPKGTLAIERLRDANQAAKAEGEIKTLAFHPSPAVSILMTVSSDRRLRLFNVDGHTNPHIKTIHIPELPMTNACFHPSGTSILLTGPRPFYYTYDLQSEKPIRSPRGLWGTTFTHQNNQKSADKSMEIFAFNPKGNILAVAGRRGYVHLVDWSSGASQVVGSVKMNSAVKAVCWTRDARPSLMSLGDDAEVYMWDVGERRCVRRWKDDGGFGSNVMTSDVNGRYLSIGSKTGFVNVYGSNAFEASLSASNPKPLKAFGNLTTSISHLRFNHDSQLLAIASHTKKDQMRLIHLPSLTAFSNWPTSSTPLGHVSSIDFSPGSEYLAIGNNRGRVLLYHLPHFLSR